MDDLTSVEGDVDEDSGSDTLSARSSTVEPTSPNEDNELPKHIPNAASEACDWPEVCIAL